jgi:flagellar M-ring protein FliF
MDLKTVASQLVELYNNLNSKQKVVIVATVFAVIAFIAFIVVFTGTKAAKGEYTVLFERLDPADSALILEQLQANKVPYEIPRDGVIAVPQDVVYEQRIKMASLGIPKHSNVGFELFDTKEFGATEFDQEVKFLRALEGELSRTIESLSPIDQAVVKLAIPKESVFVRQSVEPTASVVVRMNEQFRITNKQVDGIKNLVSAAVAKLKPENVKVINEYGETVGDTDEFAEAGEVARVQLRYKKDYEKSLEEKIVSALAPIVGGGDRVVANVDVHFDFSQKDSTEEVFDPENVIRSEQTFEESKEGAAAEQIGGVPGAVGNIGPVEGLADDRMNEKYEKSQTTTNFEISKRVSNIKGAFATISRISAAVIVDGEYQSNAEGVIEYTPRSDAQLQQMQRVVEQSIGISEDRGDTAVVTNFQFKATSQAMEVDPIKAQISQVEYYLEPFYPVLKYLFVFLVLFVFYKKVIAPYAQKMLEIKQGEEESIRPSLMIEEEEDDNLSERYGSMRKKVEEQLGLAAGDFNEDEMRYEIVLEKLREASEENPEEIANLLALLIRDETEMERNAMQNS